MSQDLEKIDSTKKAPNVFIGVHDDTGAPAAVVAGEEFIIPVLIPPEEVYTEITFRIEHLRIVTCESIITLNAEVSNTDGTHTFEWVQIAGTPVEWLEDTHQITVMWRQPVIRDDKVFRFYVDRNTAHEMSDTMTVTAKPTDYTGPMLTTSGEFAQFLPHNQQNTPFIYMAPQLRDEEANIFYDTSSTIFVGTPPTQFEKVSATVLERYNTSTGVWEIVETAIGYVALFTAEQDRSYRVIFVFDGRFGVRSVSISNTVSYTSTDSGIGRTGATSTGYAIFSNSSPAICTLLELANLDRADTDADDTALFNTSFGQNIGIIIERVSYTVATTDTPEEYLEIPFINTTVDGVVLERDESTLTSLG